MESIIPSSSMAFAAPLLASCILDMFPPAAPGTVMDMDPERSMTMAMATASFLWSFLSSMEMGRSLSMDDWKYPPDPNECLPPTIMNPPPWSRTKKFRESRNVGGISWAGTLLNMTALVPERSPMLSDDGSVMVSTLIPCAVSDDASGSLVYLVTMMMRGPPVISIHFLDLLFPLCASFSGRISAENWYPPGLIILVWNSSLPIPFMSSTVVFGGLMASLFLYMVMGILPSS